MSSPTPPSFTDADDWIVAPRTGTLVEGSAAEAAPTNEGLARRFVEECRRRQVILPGLSVLERLCAGALVAAERRIEASIVAGLDDAMRMGLDRLLTPAAYRGGRRRREPVRLVAPVRGGPELG